MFNFHNFAENAGFEPAIRFRRIHAFQACLFNHSSISPKHLSKNGCKLVKKYELHLPYPLKLKTFYSFNVHYLIFSKFQNKKFNLKEINEIDFGYFL